MAEFTGEDLDLELGAATSVEIVTVAGEVAVTAGTGPVRVRAKVLRGAPVVVTLEGGVLRVAHELPRNLISTVLNGPSPEAVVEVVAPAEAGVRVRTVAASVVAAGFRQPPVLATVSGSITASDVAGLTVSVVSGTLEAEAVSGPVNVNSVSGDVTIIGGRLDQTAVKSVSGDVLLDVDDIGDAALNSVSGAVALRLPEDASVTLEAVTVNGRLDCAFPLADSVSTKRRLTGAVGGGGSQVRARTISGDVSLLRKRLAAT